MSERSRRTRTVIGGLAAGGALAAFAPAGIAAADVNPTKDGDQVNPETPGASVGRPDLTNPAPGVRLAQQFGDSVFNQSTAFNKTLDDSPLGTGYHQTFGTRGDLTFNEKSGKYEYTKGTGSNGSFKGVLNTPPADQLGNVLPVRECNLKGDPSSGAPAFGFRQCT
ncbi:hypothetical protein [Mycolicibacterium sp. 120270]|uniref:hypothetical protein n=1 Tax=Mycolicibacterium sp. 120270 TaxID=3090600 RepID=UPI00299F0E15|nr:hypothetical protein [Mycolicibacterium sp. 120270]MDX1885093.1 hypothetical protein [Mycolicibacterium sp. 120270]